jgi:hypothetical protein
MPYCLCWLPPPNTAQEGQRILRGSGRESFDFTLKGNRAERVQIVNEAAGA